tara:strand:+ start:1104 stop:1757 length:654 start_codon:yes stop_codon:yes gene_type:complete
MGANFSTNNINNRPEIEDIIIKYILNSSNKDVDLIDDKMYRNNTTNILVDILMKYVEYEIIDEIFYHLGGDDNMIELNLHSLRYTSVDNPIDLRLKCKFLGDFYYDIYVLYNKVKNLILAVNNLLQQVQQEYNKYQQIGDIYDDAIGDIIESLEFRINKLQLIRINFYHILGDLFVKDEIYTLNRDITLERIKEIQTIIDFEINTFSDKIQRINRCE